MGRPSFQEYEAEALAEGFDEVAERLWEPLAEAPTHSHPFAVRALVVAGDLWLTVDGNERHLRAGDTFEIERDAPHAERYGPEGATYWAARRHRQG